MQARDFAWTSTEANAAALGGDKLDVVVTVVVGSWGEIETISHEVNSYKFYKVFFLTCRIFTLSPSKL